MFFIYYFILILILPHSLVIIKYSTHDSDTDRENDLFNPEITSEAQLEGLKYLFKLDQVSLSSKIATSIENRCFQVQKNARQCEIHD